MLRTIRRSRGWWLIALVIFVGAAVAARAQKAPSGPPIKIGILPFLDASGTMSRDTAAAIGRLVQAEMTHSAPTLNGKVLTLDSGTKLEDMDAEKAVAQGKAGGVDIVILGTVLEARSQESNKSGFLPPIAGQSVGVNVRSVKANVTLQGDLYRIADGERVASLRVPGSASDNKFGGAAYTTIGAWDGHSSVFLESPLGKALQKAIEDMVKKIAVTKM